MLNNLVFDKLAMTTAIKAGVALTLAAAIAYYFHFGLFWWAIFISFLSIQPDIGSSIMMMLARLWGTVLGACIGVFFGFLYQMPGLYYTALFIFIYCALYYTIKVNVSWSGFLCLITVSVVTLIGPLYETGIFYYAIIRCFEIAFAISVVSVLLLILKGQYAHQLLRAKIVQTLAKYQTLWLDIVAEFQQQKTGSVQPLVREISTDLTAMTVMLRFARFEVWKKEFNCGQCLALLKLMKRLLALLTAINEVARYVSVNEFNENVQEMVSKLEKLVFDSLSNLSTLVSTTAKSYSLKIDEIEQEFYTLMNTRLTHHLKAKKHGDKLPLHRIAWFSLVARIFYSMARMRKVVVLMNRDKVDLKLRGQLNQEQTWLLDENKREAKFNPVRIKLALHATLSVVFIVLLQQYFHWPTIICLFSVITVTFISLSLVMPLMANIGLGIVGALCGSAYAYFSSFILSYYPNIALVLFLLFCGTVIAAYCMTISKLYNRSLLIFSIYFALCFVYVLSQPVAMRADFEIPLLLIFSVLLSVLVYAVVSKFIFSINYERLLRTRLVNCLIAEGRLMRGLAKVKSSKERVIYTRSAIYHQATLIDRARTAIRYCQDSEIYSSAKIKSLYELTYSCELMQAVSLNLLHPYLVLSQHELSETVRAKLKPEYHAIVRNLFQYARCLKSGTWDKHVITQVDAMKARVDSVFNEVADNVIQHEHAVEQLRALSIVYNGFYRMVDIQNRLLSTKGLTIGLY